MTTICEIKVREVKDSEGKVKKERKVYVDYEYNEKNTIVYISVILTPEWKKVMR